MRPKLRPKFCPKASEMSEVPSTSGVRNVRESFRTRTFGHSDGMFRVSVERLATASVGKRGWQEIVRFVMGLPVESRDGAYPRFAPFGRAAGQMIRADMQKDEFVFLARSGAAIVGLAGLSHELDNARALTLITDGRPGIAAELVADIRQHTGALLFGRASSPSRVRMVMRYCDIVSFAPLDSFARQYCGEQVHAVIPLWSRESLRWPRCTSSEVLRLAQTEQQKAYARWAIRTPGALISIAALALAQHFPHQGENLVMYMRSQGVDMGAELGRCPRDYRALDEVAA